MIAFINEQNLCGIYYGTELYRTELIASRMYLLEKL